MYLWSCLREGNVISCKWPSSSCKPAIIRNIVHPIIGPLFCQNHPSHLTIMGERAQRWGSPPKANHCCPCTSKHPKSHNQINQNQKANSKDAGWCPRPRWLVMSQNSLRSRHASRASLPQFVDFAINWITRFGSSTVCWCLTSVSTPVCLMMMALVHRNVAHLFIVFSAPAIFSTCSLMMLAICQWNTFRVILFSGKKLILPRNVCIQCLPLLWFLFIVFLQNSEDGRSCYRNVNFCFLCSLVHYSLLHNVAVFFLFNLVLFPSSSLYVSPTHWQECSETFCSIWRPHHPGEIWTDLLVPFFLWQMLHWPNWQDYAGWDQRACKCNYRSKQWCL